MAKRSIKFEGPEFDGEENKLGGLRDTLNTAANNEALNKFGEDYWPDPTDMTITPVVTMDEPRFMVNAHHSTASEAGAVAVFQPHDFSFTFTIEGEEAYLRTDTERAYPITSRELYFLMKIGTIATLKTVHMLEFDD